MAAAVGRAEAIFRAPPAEDGERHTTLCAGVAQVLAERGARLARGARPRTTTQRAAVREAGAAGARRGLRLRLRGGRGRGRRRRGVAPAARRRAAGAQAAPGRRGAGGRRAPGRGRGRRGRGPRRVRVVVRRLPRRLLRTTRTTTTARPTCPRTSSRRRRPQERISVIVVRPYSQKQEVTPRSTRAPAPRGPRLPN